MFGVPPQMHPAHPPGLVEMGVGSLEAFAALAQQSPSAGPPDPPAIGIHGVAGSELDRARLQVDRVLGLVGQMRPAVLHFRQGHGSTRTRPPSRRRTRVRDRRRGPRPDPNEVVDSNSCC